MKCKIPEISWHNRDPVLSVDIQPCNSSNADETKSLYRLATGGTDTHVLIWFMNFATDGADLHLELAADLTRHQRAVNTVRWSPNGELLASGDDDSVVFIWKQKPEHEPLNILDNDNEQDKEVWIVHKILRGHMEDVYDLSWAPNSQFLVSGSVDNSAIVWDVQKGKSVALLKDHKSFVQGVAWDPKNQYIATMSSDRYLRIFDIQSKRVVHRINKSILPVAEGHELHGQRVRLFHDDTLQSFFRRLSFTPDGKLLLTPAGVSEDESGRKYGYSSYAFSRYALRQPAIVLPMPDQYTVAVRCCPLLFRLRPHNAATNAPVVPLPYRMIFAVATRSSVYFFDTQQKQPFAVISNIHYTRLSDLTWSSDGRIVVVSSTDGFCSLITFEPGELGEEYENAKAVFSANMENSIPSSAKKSKKHKENQNQTAKPVAEVAKESTLESPDAREPLQASSQAETVTNGVDQQTPSDKKKTTGPAVVILDKEILSSDEKFESPEKKCHIATPIMIRRTPRSVPAPADVPMTPKSDKPSGSTAFTPTNAGYKSPLTVKHSAAQAQRATPISVRRTPRAILPSTSTITTKSETGVPTTEEALDTWPQPIDPTPAEANIGQHIGEPAEEKMSFECTEDIRLVYEDTVEEATNPKVDSENVNKDEDVNMEEKIETDNVVDVSTKEECKEATAITQKDTPKGTATPKAKTPRRVELKTIWTPKSKKPLME